MQLSQGRAVYECFFHSDVLPIFGWTIRGISSDVNWYIEAADKDLMVDFIEEVHKKVRSSLQILFHECSVSV